MSLIEVNNDMRVIMDREAFFVMLLTGTDKIRSGYGNGDGLLIDSEHYIFAIADATERFPNASRILLSKIMGGLTNIPDTSEQWRAYINAIYHQQEYHLKTTLSLIALKQSHNGCEAFVVHGGDSSLNIFNRLNKKLLYKSTANMNFAGRSTSIDTIDSINLESNTRIVIHSDGFNDIMKIGSIDFDDLVAAPLFDCISLILTQVNAENVNNEYDDVGLLIVDIPEIFNVIAGSIVMGGTTHCEERCLQNNLTICDYSSLIKTF